jgi:hypothetical protein
MKKLLILCTALYSMSVSMIYALPLANDLNNMYQVKKCKNKTHMKNICSHYCMSVLLSACVGATTGGLVKHAEKKLNVEASSFSLFLFLLSWTLESEFRNDMIALLQQDLDAYGIGHKKNLMFKAAWIASWLAYLQL